MAEGGRGGASKIEIRSEKKALLFFIFLKPFLVSFFKFFEPFFFMTVMRLIKKICHQGLIMLQPALNINLSKSEHKSGSKNKKTK